MLMTILPTSMGEFRAYADENGLHNLLFPGCSSICQSLRTRQVHNSEHPVFRKLAQQLNQYLQGKRRTFTLPVTPHGTTFQQMTWKLLCDIPYGTTVSYGDLAEKLGSKNRARAVGGAAHANPLPIIIPCHRLIGANGKLTGFAGGLSMKRQLLELEAAVLLTGKTNEKQSDNR